MDELAATLDREAVLLEVLVFRLQTLRQLLANGDDRFLGWAAEEVEDAAGRVREVELRRALIVADLAASEGRPESDYTLSVLADTAVEPFRTVFAAQRAQLRGLVDEVADGLASVRRMARTGLSEVSEALRRVAGLAGAPEPRTGPYAYASAGQAIHVEQRL